MRLLDKLEPKLGRFAVPNLTLGIIVCQVIAYAGIRARPALEQRLSLIPALVLTGEVWRLVSFLCMPPTTVLIFAIFAWYMFFLMGTALEHQWGTFRYNVYLLIGCVATIAVSFVMPNSTSQNQFLYGSVFLAFAFLYPDFELYIFFILPLKIKWIALLTWIGYFVTLIFGSWLSRLLVLASLCNFLLFFHRDILEMIRTGRRRMAMQTAQLPSAQEKPFFHRCTVCGITDRTDPDMDFRYCSKCDGAHGYCTKHLHDHQHIVVEKEANEPRP